MSVANSRSHVVAASPAPAERTSVFKENRPRHIDRFISFFGDGESAGDDPCGEQLLAALGGDRWSAQ